MRMPGQKLMRRRVKTSDGPPIGVGGEGHEGERVDQLQSAATPRGSAIDFLPIPEIEAPRRPDSVLVGCCFVQLADQSVDHAKREKSEPMIDAAVLRLLCLVIRPPAQVRI